MIQKQILGTLSVPTTVGHSQKGKSQRGSDPLHPHSEKSEASFVPLPPSFHLSRSSGVLEWPPNRITKTRFVRRPEWWLVSNLRTNLGHSRIFLWEQHNEVKCVRTARKLQGSGCLQAGGRYHEGQEVGLISDPGQTSHPPFLFPFYFLFRFLCLLSFHLVSFLSPSSSLLPPLRPSLSPFFK